MSVLAEQFVPQKAERGHDCEAVLIIYPTGDALPLDADIRDNGLQGA